MPYVQYMTSQLIGDILKRWPVCVRWGKKRQPSRDSRSGNSCIEVKLGQFYIKFKFPQIENLMLEQAKNLVNFICV